MRTVRKSPGRFITGSIEQVLPGLPEASYDAIVTDPPYGLEFMSVGWDTFSEPKGGSRLNPRSEWGDFGSREHPRTAQAAARIQRNKNAAFQLWCENWTAECFRVLKPGGFLLAFGGTRTYHRLACAIEDAGFEIRDSLHWLYGSGFPKSKNIGDGWGTALKPAHEPIILARKPLSESTVAGNVLRYGTGALNIDGCRVGTDLRVNPPAGNQPGGASLMMSVTGMPQHAEAKLAEGRWPPNLLLGHSADCRETGTRRVNGTQGGTTRDGVGVLKYGGTNSRPQHADVGGDTQRPGYADSDGLETVQAWDCAAGCPVAGLDAQSGTLKDGVAVHRNGVKSGGYGGSVGRLAEGTADQGYGGQGGASRFFPEFQWSPEYDLPFMYCAKAPKKERPQVPGVSGHPTVKPLALMRWLVRLVTPPGGLILDPFAGTGTTIQAALDEGFRCTGVDSWLDAVELAKNRLASYDCSFR